MQNTSETPYTIGATFQRPYMVTLYIEAEGLPAEQLDSDMPGLVVAIKAEHVRLLKHIAEKSQYEKP